MAITFVGASGQAASTTSGGTIAGAWPSGYTAVADDVAFIVAAGKHNNGSSLAPSTPTGYTLLATEFSEGGTYDLQLTVFYKVLTTGEAAAVITVPAAYSGNSGGLSRTTFVYRGMNVSSLIDAAAVLSDSNFVAFSSFTPSGVTTNSNNAMVISFVATADDNDLALSPAQSFTLRAGGVSYDTTIGGDHSIGVADRIIASPSTPSMCGWNLALNSPDYWSAITASFAEGTSAVTRTATGSGTGTQSANRLVIDLRTATGSGTGTQTASGARVGNTVSRTATGSGAGTQTASPLRVVLRGATASGAGTQTASGSVTAGAVTRTASGSGTGTQTASRLVVRVRTATGSGTSGFDAFPNAIRARVATGSGAGSATATRVRVAVRTATGSGAGTQTGVVRRVVTSTATASGAGTAITITLKTAIRTASSSAIGAGQALSERIFEIPVPIGFRPFRKHFYPPPSKPVTRGKPLQPPRVKW